MLYELLFEPTLQIRTPSTCMTSNAGNYKTSRLDSRHKTIFAHIGRLDVATRQRSSLNMSNTTCIESARLQYKIHWLAFQTAKWCHAMWCRSAVENGQLSASLAQLKMGLIRGGAWRAVGLYGAKWCFENAMTLMNLPRSLSDEWMHGILGCVCARLEMSCFGDEWGPTLSRAFNCDWFGTHRCHAISTTSMRIALCLEFQNHRTTQT
jgi:hypothetical protein